MTPSTQTILTARSYNHLQHVNFPDLGDITEQVLLGVDASWRNAERDISKCSTGTSYAVKSVPDSSITGLLSQKSIIPESNSHFSNFIDLTKLEDAILTAIVKKNLEGGRIRHSGR